MQLLRQFEGRPREAEGALPEEESGLSWVLIQGDCLEVLRKLPADSVDALVTDPPAGISFMGKSWDSDKGGRTEWIAWLESVLRECYRVMKPGAHGLVWALPRTSHWTGQACEQAGFEVRDVVSHLFGSGFPKSLDISKAIDKAAGAEREKKPMRQIDGERMIAQTVHAKCLICGKWQFSGNPCVCPDPSKTAITDAAKQWAGFGTALKPAAEFWWLIRKPLSEKTVAANVLKWGTGGLNIDGSRVENAGKSTARITNAAIRGGNLVSGRTEKGPMGGGHEAGRFPANLVFTCACADDAQHELGCAVAELDRQSGHLIGAGNKKLRKPGEGRASASLFGVEGGAPTTLYDRGGTASRFFYCAKVSASERGDSKHPTMKSLKLMRYLIRLITPPGGTVLDPFMGSGSTGVAAIQEGFGFMGIEREAEYREIATARLIAYQGTAI